MIINFLCLPLGLLCCVKAAVWMNGQILVPSHCPVKSTEVQVSCVRKESSRYTPEK